MAEYEDEFFKQNNSEEIPVCDTISKNFLEIDEFNKNSMLDLNESISSNET